ncbi:calcium-binding protein [Aestuariivirga sp.]|uniref:calcium-binding protein n=1 Tax=Aestuariivirga sp. TaxID=2650926 RepID=UPI00359347D6
MKYLYGNYNRNILVATAPDSYTIYGYNGADDIYGQDFDDFLYAGSGDDLVFGYDGDDFINGNDGWDVLKGGKGNDTLNGNDGYDLLQGAKGNDILNGGDDWDDIYGGDGRDTLTGGQDDDFLVGGRGKDIFVFRHGDDSDVIADFTPDVDKIELDLNYVQNFAQLRQYIYRDGPDTIIDLKDGDFLILAWVNPNSLDSGDFIFT